MKLVAFAIPDDWELGDINIEIRDGLVAVARKFTDHTMFLQHCSDLRTDVIALGEQYSSADYKIITETEGDHMLFKVVSRKDV